LSGSPAAATQTFHVRVDAGVTPPAKQRTRRTEAGIDHMRLDGLYDLLLESGSKGG